MRIVPAMSPRYTYNHIKCVRFHQTHTEKLFSKFETGIDKNRIYPKNIYLHVYLTVNLLGINTVLSIINPFRGELFGFTKSREWIFFLKMAEN